jgi:hypothetical protein
VYGEVSFITDEDADNAYGTKIGAKYKFWWSTLNPLGLSLC